MNLSSWHSSWLAPYSMPLNSLQSSVGRQPPPQHSPLRRTFVTPLAAVRQIPAGFFGKLSLTRTFDLNRPTYGSKEGGMTCGLFMERLSSGGVGHAQCLSGKIYTRMSVHIYRILWDSQASYNFCRAMLYINAAYAVARCLSVRLSVRPSRSCMLSKQINISSNFLYRRVATLF